MVKTVIILTTVAVVYVLLYAMIAFLCVDWHWLEHSWVDTEAGFVERTAALVFFIVATLCALKMGADIAYADEQ